MGKWDIGMLTQVSIAPGVWRVWQSRINPDGDDINANRYGALPQLDRGYDIQRFLGTEGLLFHCQLGEISNGVFGNCCRIDCMTRMFSI